MFKTTSVLFGIKYPTINKPCTVKQTAKIRNKKFAFENFGKTTNEILKAANKNESRKTSGKNDFDGPNTFMNPFRKYKRARPAVILVSEFKFEI